MISTHLYTHIYMCVIAYMCNYMFKARNTCTPIYQDSGSLDHHVYNIYIMYVTCCCLCTYTYLYICVHAYFLVHVCLCVCILRLLRLFIPIQVYTSLYIFNPFYIIFIPSIFVSLPLPMYIIWRCIYINLDKSATLGTDLCIYQSVYIDFLLIPPMPP